MTTPSGVSLISAERARQVAEEGWSQAHDLSHTSEELAWAAVCYAAPGYPTTVYRKEDRPRNTAGQGEIRFVDPWPFGRQWDKRTRSLPRGHPLWVAAGRHAERIMNLVKAAALCAAEIDRLMAVAQAEAQEEDEE